MARMIAPDGLDLFLEDVRSSCSEFAERKGYMRDGIDVLGEASRMLGVAREHAIGEILAKLVEFRRQPRRVVAAKIAGWAWRLWMDAPPEAVEGGKD